MLNRRKFLQTGAAGLVTFAALPTLTRADEANAAPSAPLTQVPHVKLGNSGLLVSQIAMGTGSIGSNKSSNQTRLGVEKFNALVSRCYEHGIQFFDMADSYGSQPFVGRAIKGLPREKLVLSTKIWTEEDKKKKAEKIPATIDRILKEIGTDYLDILLMHCLMKGGWTEHRSESIAALSKAKKKGRVKAVGDSCHNSDALVEAASSPWVDIIFARINPFGVLMDNKPDKVKEILQKAIANGKGVVAMKIFGEGKCAKTEEREQSIKFALQEVGIRAMTLGMESPAQIDDAVERVVRLAKK